MYSITRMRKTTSARTAFSVIDRPHDELTELTLTSVTSTPAFAARSAATCCWTASGCSSTSRRTSSLLPSV